MNFKLKLIFIFFYKKGKSKIKSRVKKWSGIKKKCWLTFFLTTIMIHILHCYPFHFLKQIRLTFSSLSASLLMKVNSQLLKILFVQRESKQLFHIVPVSGLKLQLVPVGSLELKYVQIFIPLAFRWGITSSGNLHTFKGEFQYDSTNQHLASVVAYGLFTLREPDPAVGWLKIELKY